MDEQKKGGRDTNLYYMLTSAVPEPSDSVLRRSPFPTYVVRSRVLAWVILITGVLYIAAIVLALFTVPAGLGTSVLFGPPLGYVLVCLALSYRIDAMDIPNSEVRAALAASHVDETASSETRYAARKLRDALAAYMARKMTVEPSVGAADYSGKSHARGSLLGARTRHVAADPYYTLAIYTYRAALAWIGGVIFAAVYTTLQILLLVQCNGTPATALNAAICTDAYGVVVASVAGGATFTALHLIAAIVDTVIAASLYRAFHAAVRYAARHSSKLDRREYP